MVNTAPQTTAIDIRVILLVALGWYGYAHKEELKLPIPDWFNNGGTVVKVKVATTAPSFDSTFVGADAKADALIAATYFDGMRDALLYDAGPDGKKKYLSVGQFYDALDVGRDYLLKGKKFSDKYPKYGQAMADFWKGKLGADPAAVLSVSDTAFQLDEIVKSLKNASI